MKKVAIKAFLYLHMSGERSQETQLCEILEIFCETTTRVKGLEDKSVSSDPPQWHHHQLWL